MSERSGSSQARLGVSLGPECFENCDGPVTEAEVRARYSPEWEAQCRRDGFTDDEIAAVLREEIRRVKAKAARKLAP
jgi:hypothetical protein